jgi:hypothetical protein
MPPVAVEGVTTPDRKLWGIPGSVYPVVTFFNADLFAETGLLNPRELGEQWTWETLASSAKRLTRDKDGDGVNETYGTSRISYRWEMQVHQAGGQLYDRVAYPTKSQFNSPEVLRAVEFIRRALRGQYRHQQPYDLQCLSRYMRDSPWLTARVRSVPTRMSASMGHCLATRRGQPIEQPGSIRTVFR